MPCHVPATSISSCRRPSPLPLPPCPRYLLDGQEVDLRELLAVNDFGGDEVAAIRNLLSGESMTLGGGAAGELTLTRLPPEGGVLEVTLLIAEPPTTSLVGRRLSSSIKPDGYRIEVYCIGWGKNTSDGSVRLDLVATFKSPEGAQTGGAP
jgi:hypothetical protein